MNNIKVFLFASPNDSQNVYKTTRNCTFFNYYMDKNGLLRRKNVQPGNMSALMYLSDYGIDKCPEIDIPKLSSDIVSECRNRRYSGIFLDFENRSSMELLRNTGQNAIRNGIIPFIPVSFAGCVQNVKLVIPSAISGGSFEQMLREYKAKYGAENLCLDIMRTCQDFTMPSYMPEGKSLNNDEFEKLKAEYSPSSFFSKDLCSKYFTYRCNGEYHFVIYDDASTAVSKLEIADSLGFYSAFILYSDFRNDVKYILNA